MDADLAMEHEVGQQTANAGGSCCGPAHSRMRCGTSCFNKLLAQSKVRTSCGLCQTVCFCWQVGAAAIAAWCVCASARGYELLVTLLLMFHVVLQTAA
jgi:hypothetical protein